MNPVDHSIESFVPTRSIHSFCLSKILSIMSHAITKCMVYVQMKFQTKNLVKYTKYSLHFQKGCNSRFGPSQTILYFSKFIENNITNYDYK